MPVSSASSSRGSKAYIVNLSSLHTLHLASLLSFLSQGTNHPAIRAFVSLSSRYSVSCCPIRLFPALPHLTWVITMFRTHRELINAYKTSQSMVIRGERKKVTTDVFLDEMLEIFDFLKDAEFRANDIQRVYEKRLYLLSLKDIQDIPEGLTGIWDAWNGIIDFVDADIAKWRLLSSINEDNAPIYLISNSNELNIQAILTMLWQHGCIPCIPDTITVSASSHGLPIIQIPNTPIFLCLSYHFGCFKEDAATGTPGIIRTLLDSADIEISQVEVISQFQGDLTTAARTGVQHDHLHRAEVFFAGSVAASHLKMD